MPPEYVIDGLFSVKSDVFSFGVMVLEIVSGKKNRGFDHPDHDLNLLGHVSLSPNSYIIWLIHIRCKFLRQGFKLLCFRHGSFGMKVEHWNWQMF